MTEIDLRFCPVLPLHDQIVDVQRADQRRLRLEVEAVFADTCGNATFSCRDGHSVDVIANYSKQAVERPLPGHLEPEAFHEAVHAGAPVSLVRRRRT